jgi:ferrous iron transport protein A
MTTLGELQVGDRGKVTGYSEAGGAYRRKLLSMGLTPGIDIHIVRVAPMGDPVEIRVRGCNLSLRKEEAASLNVEKL